jgi:hypothetical protein
MRVSVGAGQVTTAVARLSATVGLLILAILLHVGRERWVQWDPVHAQQLLHVRSPESLRRMALEFDALVADIYWIRALQHYGGERLAPTGATRRYEQLYPLLDMTTSLDPYFGIAYRFGAIFLSEPYPGGPGRPDLAITLLRKGIAAQPTRWHYYHDIGFVHYWALQDPQGAAAWFRQAAAIPGAPNWLLTVAAAMLTETRDRTAARYVWQQILQTDKEWLRKRAERGLLQLDALDQIDRLSTMVSSASRRAGEPYSWPALVRGGALGGIPVDPSGTPYDIDPATGRVTVSKGSPLFPMPVSKERSR